MIYEIKFLCDNDIYSVSLTLPEDIFKGKTTDDIDSLLTDCINFEKEYHDLSDHEHIITQMRKAENGIDWIEMI